MVVSKDELQEKDGKKNGRTMIVELRSYLRSDAFAGEIFYFYLCFFIT